VCHGPYGKGMTYQALLALFAGAAIATQAGLNASLGKQLGSPLFATVVAFGAGLGFTLLATLAVARQMPAAVAVRAVPSYLWFTGRLFSAFAIVSFYWLIPRMGIGATMSFTLTGQLLLALVAGHYGWFQLPLAPLSPMKMTGAATLLVGVVLVNKG
jgi:transporter family-2 protein